MVIGPRRVERVLRGEAGALHQALEALVHGLDAVHLVGAADLQVVLQVLADARELVRHRDAVLSAAARRGRCPTAAGSAAMPMAPAARITSRARLERALLRRAGA